MFTKSAAQKFLFWEKNKPQKLLWQLHWRPTPAVWEGRATGLAEVSTDSTGSTGVCKAGCVRYGGPYWGSLPVWSQHCQPNLSVRMKGRGRRQTGLAWWSCTWGHKLSVKWQFTRYKITVCLYTYMCFCILTCQPLLGSWQQKQNTPLHHSQQAGGHSSCSIAANWALKNKETHFTNSQQSKMSYTGVSCHRIVAHIPDPLLRREPP